MKPEGDTPVCLGADQTLRADTDDQENFMLHMDDEYLPQIQSTPLFDEKDTYRVILFDKDAFRLTFMNQNIHLTLVGGEK